MLWLCDVLQQILSELQILHKCDSEYIIKYYGSVLNENRIMICTEYMDGTFQTVDRFLNVSWIFIGFLAVSWLFDCLLPVSLTAIIRSYGWWCVHVRILETIPHACWWLHLCARAMDMWVRCFASGILRLAECHCAVCNLSKVRRPCAFLRLFAISVLPRNLITSLDCSVIHCCRWI